MEVEVYYGGQRGGSMPYTALPAFRLFCKQNGFQLKWDPKNKRVDLDSGLKGKVCVLYAGTAAGEQHPYEREIVEKVQRFVSEYGMEIIVGRKNDTAANQSDVAIRISMKEMRSLEKAKIVLFQPEDSRDLTKSLHSELKQTGMTCLIKGSKATKSGASIVHLQVQIPQFTEIYKRKTYGEKIAFYLASGILNYFQEDLRIQPFAYLPPNLLKVFFDSVLLGQSLTSALGTKNGQEDPREILPADSYTNDIQVQEQEPLDAEEFTGVLRLVEQTELEELGEEQLELSIHGSQPVAVDEEQETAASRTLDSLLEMDAEWFEEQEAAEALADSEPVAAEESPEVLEPVAAVESSEALEPVAAKESSEALEPLAAEESPEVLEPVAAEESSEVLEPLAAEESSEALEPLTAEESPEVLEPVAAVEPSEALEPLAAEESLEASEPVAAAVMSPEALEPIAAAEPAIATESTLAPEPVASPEPAVASQPAEFTAASAPHAVHAVQVEKRMEAEVFFDYTLIHSDTPERPFLLIGTLQVKNTGTEDLYNPIVCLRVTPPDSIKMGGQILPPKLIETLALQDSGGMKGWRYLNDDWFIHAQERGEYWIAPIQPVLIAPNSTEAFQNFQISFLKQAAGKAVMVEGVVLCNDQEVHFSSNNRIAISF